jgi:hypothetical protein
MAISNEEEYRRLRGKLTINPMQLDQEWIEMPQLVQDATEYAMSAVQMRDSAKSILAFREAEAANTLRNRMVVSGKGGEPKQRTESQINSEVPLDDAVQQAQADFIDCKYDADLWMGLVDSLREKSRALKTMSELMVTGFLTPAGMVTNARVAINEQRQSGIARRPLSTG